MGVPSVSISIISHRHGPLVKKALEHLSRCCSLTTLEVILTVNVPEPLPFGILDFPFTLRVIHNTGARGFGANHNHAFSQTTSPFFCVTNPDIELADDPFPPLLAALADPKVAVVAPMILSPFGTTEDSTRKLPSPTRIFKRVLLRQRQSDYDLATRPLEVEWVAGIFMLFKREMFSLISGFDERFFLYLEDVDLCARARSLGLSVRVEPAARVIHAARRDSHRKLRYVWWHGTGMMRFWFRYLTGRYRNREKII